MKTKLLTVSLASPGVGVATGATVHALYLDPARAAWAETWLSLDPDNRSATWSLDLAQTPSEQARIGVGAELEVAPGGPRQSVNALLDVGASWTISGSDPTTVWVLPFDLDWKEIASVQVEVGRTDGKGGLVNPVEVKLTSGSGPVAATVAVDRPGELAYVATYRLIGGSVLSTEQVAVDDRFITIAAPEVSELVIKVDDGLAKALKVREIVAKLSIGSGGDLSHTWSGDFSSPWSVPLTALGSGKGVAPVARLSYTVRFPKGTVQDYTAPAARLTAPSTSTLDQLGAARFSVDTAFFDTMPTASVEVELTAPVSGRKVELTAQAPSMLVSLAPDPGVVASDPASAVEYVATFKLEGGGNYRLEGESASAVIDLVNPLSTKMVSLLPVWASSGGGEIRRIQLSYRSLEEGVGWRIEGVTKSASLKAGDPALSYSFPAVDPGRAAVVYSGNIITSKGSRTIPETRATNPGLPIGGVDLWLSVTVDPTLIDWKRYGEVVVSLERQGDGGSSASFRFMPGDGPAYWGFFGAEEAERVYDWSAVYTGRDGSHGKLSGSGDTSPTLTLPNRTGG